ncbi:hypothetical protein ACOSP7_027946 [Xanthoceras sorbifolium]
MVVSYRRNGKSDAKGNIGGKNTKVGRPQLVSIDNIVKEVGKSSKPASIGSVKARGTGVAPEKSKNSKIAEENNRLKRPATICGVKGKSHMVMTGDDDVTLAKGSSIFRDISNMGPPLCKEVAGIKSRSLKSLQKAPKTKKASYAK